MAKHKILDQNLDQLQVTCGRQTADSQPKLSPTPEFPVADKVLDKPKLSQTPKFPVDD